jgi:hypothetical protein
MWFNDHYAFPTKPRRASLLSGSFQEDVKLTKIKTYADMAFDELMKYKTALINDGVWAAMDIDEKKEINGA